MALSAHTRSGLRGWVILAAVLSWSTTAMAVEEASYTRVEKDGRFELRDYAPYVVAEVKVDDFEQGGNQGFRTLFRYISGANRARQKIAMTAPVTQEAESVKIPMTAPVTQERAGEGYRLGFVMPASYTLATTPEPNDDRVTLREVPGRRMAVVRYSGRYTRKRYEKYKAMLVAWMEGRSLRADGEFVWARYNPPFVPWFLRRNEVMVPVRQQSE